MGTDNIHKNLVKFGCVVSEICKQRDKRWDVFITVLHTRLRGEENRSNISYLLCYYLTFLVV